MSFSGVVIDIGAEVSRFSIGDRVVTNSAGSLRNDPRFGGYQKYALTTQELTAKVRETFITLKTQYADMSLPDRRS